jgi:hypothetical protein
MVEQMELGETRGDLYKDSRVEVIIELLVANKKIEPKFDLSNGYTYPDLDKIMVENPGENRDEFLRKMVKAKVLDKELFDIELRCPKCKSPDFSTRYLCPFCKSMTIIKNVLVEHINCGQTSTKSGLREESWFDFCPNCNKKYSEGGYRVVGKWFECSNCAKQIRNPMIAHFCRNCHNIFSFDDATQREIYCYSLNSEAKKEIENGVVFPSEIEKVLTNANYAIKDSNVANGKSGIKHKFNFVSSNNKKTIAVDTIFSSKPITETEILKEQIKLYDTGIEIYVIVTPKLSEQASVFAKGSQLKIIEAPNKKDALTELRKSLL